jgi:hypothetical protein
MRIAPVDLVAVSFKLCTPRALSKPGKQGFNSETLLNREIVLRNGHNLNRVAETLCRVIPHIHRESVGSIIGAIMVLAPRIMRGELDKLPRHYLSGGSAGQLRDEADLAQLQRRLGDDSGIGIDLLCDFLHGIPGFTRADRHRGIGAAVCGERGDHGPIAKTR